LFSSKCIDELKEDVLLPENTSVGMCR